VEHSLKIVDNIEITGEAKDWLLRHYMWPDTEDPLQLPEIPLLWYTVETRDGAGRRIAGPRHLLTRQRPDQIGEAVVTAFENGRKFVAVGFDRPPHDDRATYLIEYVDGVWYVLRQ
jgi:hypothetical protein